MRSGIDKMEVKIEDKETSVKEWVMMIIIIHWARKSPNHSEAILLDQNKG